MNEKEDNEWNKIEYQQLRQDIRHTNTLFYQIFFIMMVALGLLLNILFGFALNPDINMNHRLLTIFLVGIVGIGTIWVAHKVTKSLYYIRKKLYDYALNLYKSDFLINEGGLHKTNFKPAVGGEFRWF